MDDLASIAVLGEEFLVHPGLVVADQRVGTGKDIVGRTVILVEDDRLRIWKIAVKIDDDVDIGTAPGEDRLIGIADHIDVVVNGG